MFSSTGGCPGSDWLGQRCHRKGKSQTRLTPAGAAGPQGDATGRCSRLQDPAEERHRPGREPYVRLEEGRTGQRMYGRLWRTGGAPEERLHRGEGILGAGRGCQLWGDKVLRVGHSAGTDADWGAPHPVLAEAAGWQRAS